MSINIPDIASPNQGNGRYGRVPEADLKKTTTKESLAYASTGIKDTEMLLKFQIGGRSTLMKLNSGKRLDPEDMELCTG
jgi:hypothetical protein